MPYHSLPYLTPCHTTRLLFSAIPLAVGDSPGGIRIGWPYYLYHCLCIVWRFHPDRHLNLNQAFAAVMSGLFHLLWIGWNGGNKCWTQKPGLGRIGWIYIYTNSYLNLSYLTLYHPFLYFNFHWAGDNLDTWYISTSRCGAAWRIDGLTFSGQTIQRMERSRGFLVTRVATDQLSSQTVSTCDWEINQIQRC